MERQTGLETAHYGRRMREECGGSGLRRSNKYRIEDRGSDRASTKALDEGRRWLEERGDGERDRRWIETEIGNREKGEGHGRVTAREGSGESKDESMNESADNNAERSNDIQLNRTAARKYAVV